MPGHHLIADYLAALARRLPADAVDELADGLTETYGRHRSSGLDADRAARAAIAEFGDIDLVLRSFVRQAPGRRVARILICLGPAVGACWAVALAQSHAWNWPIPVPLRLALIAALVAVVAALVVAATALRSYRRTRLAVVAGLGLIALDGTMIATVLLTAPAFAWPIALAIPASLTRIALTARAMPTLLSR